MKKYIYIVFALSISLVFFWEWPWSSGKDKMIIENDVVKLDIGDYNIVINDSGLNWKGYKAIGSSHNGDIKIKSGKISITKNNNIEGKVVIDMTTINNLDLSGEWKAKLEGHLKSDDFFGVEKYNTSTISFKSKTQKGDQIDFIGDLTIKDITHPISFTAKISKEENSILALSSIVFDRAKYNVRYGSGTFFDGLGDNLILDDIYIDVSLLVTK